MMDWIHCNRCFVTPGSRADQQFWFSACGHLICWNCLKSTSSLMSAKGQPGHCIICQKPTRLIEVNSKMKPEMLAFFRQPKELLAEFTTRVKQVMEFQSYQMKHLQEKAIKCVRTAKAEAQLCKENERVALQQRDNLKLELGRAMEKTRQLEKMLHETRKESQHPSQKRGHGSTSSMSIHRHRVHPIASVGPNRSFHTLATHYPATTGNSRRSPFVSMSNSFYNYSMNTSSKNSTPLLPGRITKGPIIPRSLDIHYRNDTESFDT